MECINDKTKKLNDFEIKERSDAKVIELFINLVNYLSSCKQNTQKCGAMDFVESHNVYYFPTSKTKDKGIYLVEKDSDPPNEEGLVKKDNDLIRSDLFILLKNENDELEEGYIFKNNKATFTSEDNKIIVTS